MKKALLFSTILFTTFAYTQTKTIAHKRHSSNMKNFSFLLSSAGASNLGAAPERYIRNSELKKVIFINDTTQAMVTEDACVDQYQLQQATVWRAGTDTVQKHPVFSSGISVDSMRTILKSDYYFANDMEEVQFVDFEKREVIPSTEKEIRIEKMKAQVQKHDKKRSQKSAFGKYGWLLLVVATSLGIGVINIR